MEFSPPTGGPPISKAAITQGAAAQYKKRKRLNRNPVGHTHLRQKETVTSERPYRTKTATVLRRAAQSAGLWNKKAVTNEENQRSDTATGRGGEGSSDRKIEICHARPEG